MYVSLLFNQSLQRLKTVFLQQPLEMLLIVVFSIAILTLNIDAFLRNSPYWLFFPIYFAMIYLARHRYILYWLMPIILTLLTIVLVMNFGESSEFYFKRTEFWGVLLISLICFLSENWRKNNRDYVFHFVKRASNLFILAAISGGLCVGAVMAIVSSINYLFGLEFSLRVVWERVSLFGLYGLIPLFFLIFEQQKEEQNGINRFIEFLINFIVSPVLIIYSVILYFYLGKIALATELPKGNVSYIVLPYLYGAIITAALQLLLHKPRWARFYRVLPFILPAPLMLLWIGLVERITTYSFTEDRIYLLSVTLTVTVFCLLGLWKKRLQYRYLAMVAIVAVFITAIAINPKQISFDMQSARFNREMAALNLLDEQGKIKADINFQEMAKTMDGRQKERLNELSSLAQFLRRHQQGVYSQYGTEQFAALISFPYTHQKDIYPRTAWFSINDKALDLSLYKRAILLRFPIFFHQERSNGDEGEIRIIFDNQELTVFKWDGFLEKIFQENGLDPYQKYSDEQLQGLTEQFTLVETEKGLLVFRSMKIVFIKDRYQLESAEVDMFFEK